MKVKGLDGREYTWDLTGKQVGGGDTRPRSSYHIDARKLLKRLFPLSPILEEISLPGTSALRADFYIPRERMMVEVHGEQHYKYNRHFHGTKEAFVASLKRDSLKAKWCEMNNIRHVVLPYTESGDGWETIISTG